MYLPQYVNTLGQDLLHRYGEPVHKIALDVGFTCPNRDGSIGVGGCTFCNNASFSPNQNQPSLVQQIENGRRAVFRITGARLYLAYFQAYTNTYAEINRLAALYDEALAQPDVVGLSVGTRPDCVSEAVLDLLASYRQRGYEVWLELGLQSAFDETLQRVNRGHGFAAYRQTVRAAQARGLPICTHLIVGLPGEGRTHNLQTLAQVLELGVQGLKLHPLHVVRHTILAVQWKQKQYAPLGKDEYIDIACDLIERTPPQMLFHRLTATAPNNILLAPQWCAEKWPIINGIAAELARRGSYQGKKCQGNKCQGKKMDRLPAFDMDQ